MKRNKLGQFEAIDKRKGNPIYIRLEKDLENKIRKLAKTNNKTVSKIIEEALLKHYK